MKKSRWAGLCLVGILWLGLCFGASGAEIDRAGLYETAGEVDAWSVVESVSPHELEVADNTRDASLSSLPDITEEPVIRQQKTIQFESGDGTIDNPYIIVNAQQLSYLGSYLGSLGTGTYFKLGADIDLTALSDIGAPFGDDAQPFNASFDGDKYLISNLTLNAPDATYLGLFGYVGENGRVKNVKLENVTINGGAPYNSFQYIGAIAGYNAGTISTSYATGSITSNAGGGGGCNIGGLVGCNGGGSITNCYSTISVLNTMDMSNYSYLGGLVGTNYDGTISSCYAAGVVSTVSSWNIYTGGLLGSDSGFYGNNAVTNCYYDAQVYGSKGVYGKLTSELTNGALPTGFASSNWVVDKGVYPRLSISEAASAKAKASVSASVLPLPLQRFDWLGDMKFDTSLPRVSAYNASVSWNSEDPNYISVENYYTRLIKNKDSSAKLTATITCNGIPMKKTFAITINKLDIQGTGASTDPYLIDTAKKLAGLQYFVIAPNDDTKADFLLTANIDLASWEGDNYKGWRAIGDEMYPFEFSFDGGEYLISNLTSNYTADAYHGLFGYVGANGRVKNVKLENVTISGGAPYNSSLYIGAIAGYNAGTISTSYATGSITSNAGDGGGGNIGGLVGCNGGGSITNCYSMISVLNTMGAGYPSYLGGLVGINFDGTISSCYAAGVVSTQVSSWNIYIWADCWEVIVAIMAIASLLTAITTPRFTGAKAPTVN